MNCVKQGQGSLSWKAALLSCSRVSYGCAWKIQGRSLSLAPVRTVNRNRSPRLKASGRQNNVGKGSRQTRSVTSGKGLALRAGPVGLGHEAGVEPAGAGRGLSSGGPSSDRRRDLPVGCLSCAAWVLGPAFCFGRHLTADLELVRTRGIRLSN